MTAVISFLGSAVAKVFADKIIGWLALKALLSALFILVVPIILNNVMYDIMQIVFNFSTSKSVDIQSLNGVMSFTGFLGWLLDIFQLPASFSVIIGALCLRVTLKMIPFVRL